MRRRNPFTFRASIPLPCRHPISCFLRPERDPPSCLSLTVWEHGRPRWKNSSPFSSTVAGSLNYGCNAFPLTNTCTVAPSAGGHFALGICINLRECGPTSEQVSYDSGLITLGVSGLFAILSEFLRHFSGTDLLLINPLETDYASGNAVACWKDQSRTVLNDYELLLPVTEWVIGKLVFQY